MPRECFPGADASSSLLPLIVRVALRVPLGTAAGACALVPRSAWTKSEEEEGIVRSRESGDASRGGAGDSGGTAAAPCFAPRFAPSAFAPPRCVRRRRRSAEGVGGGAASSSSAASAPRARGAAPRGAANTNAGICGEEGHEVSGETSWSVFRA